MTTATEPANRSQPNARDNRLTELLELCAGGNENAFEELYQLCSAQLYGVLMRILRRESIAEEALQDSFIKIWQKAGTYIPESGSPMSWMCSIARYQGLDLLRRRGSREDNERADVHGFIDSAADTAKSMHEMTEDATLLMKCLDQLPEEARNCIVRAYCEGYSHDELAKQTDTPSGTIKSWIRRGLLSLRKCLDELS